MKKRGAFYGGLFLVIAATLMLQLVQTRLLSVAAWYYLAFFVISIAMFGLAAGAVWVYLRRERFGEATLSHDLAYFSSAFAVSAVVSLAVQLTLPVMTKATLLAVFIWAELAVCLSIPFFFAGIVVSLALTRSPYPIGRVYGVDLAGAALGCLGVLVLLDTYSAPAAVLWIGALAGLGAVLFSRSSIGRAPATLTVLTIAPAGLLMGFAFPTGMRLIAAVDRKPTPWFWGINGAAGVLAASLAIACSVALGIATTFTIGALCYLLLIPAALIIFPARKPYARAWRLSGALANPP